MVFVQLILFFACVSGETSSSINTCSVSLRYVSMLPFLKHPHLSMKGRGSTLRNMVSNSIYVPNTCDHVLAIFGPPTTQRNRLPSYNSVVCQRLQIIFDISPQMWWHCVKYTKLLFKRLIRCC